MAKFTVGPVPAFKEDILGGYKSLPLDCARGFVEVTRLLKIGGPNETTDRLGRLDDRFDVYAVPLPDCPERRMIVSIETPGGDGHRWLHGSVPARERLKLRARQLATRHHGLVNPIWEEISDT